MRNDFGDFLCYEVKVVFTVLYFVLKYESVVCTLRVNCPDIELRNTHWIAACFFVMVGSARAYLKAKTEMNQNNNK